MSCEKSREVSLSYFIGNFAISYKAKNAPQDAHAFAMYNVAQMRRKRVARVSQAKLFVLGTGWILWNTVDKINALQ